MSVLENKDYTLCVPDKWGMRFLKPSKGMELKQHQEMWLRELKYFNPIEKYATNYEWYMSNTEREISDKMCVKPTVGMTKYG